MPTMIKLKGNLIPLFALSALICCAQANADVVEVIPVNYSFDSETDSGAYNYQDEPDVNCRRINS